MVSGTTAGTASGAARRGAGAGLVRAALVPLALVAMLCLAGLALSRIYAGDLMPRLLLGAAVGAVGASVLVRRLPAWSAAPVSVAALAGFTVLAVRLAARAGAVPGGLADLTRDALRNGIPRLLTAMIPIEPQPDTVVVPVVATWLAGLAAAELALRNRRALLACTPPTLLLSGALYLVGPNARQALWLPLAYAGCAAVALAASVGGREAVEPELTGNQRTTLRVRLAAGALGGLAAIVALASLLGPTVAGRVDQTPTDPRRYVTPPKLDSLDESPLVRLSGWALNPDEHLFDATLDGDAAERGARIRLAVLSDYDGVTWRVGATYRNAGRVLTGVPDAPPSGAGSGGSDGSSGGSGGGREIEQRITIDQLEGRLLPAAATPQRVDGVRIAYDPATGTLALPGGLRPGLAYTVLSQQHAVDGNLLPSAEISTGASSRRYRTLSGTVPADLERLARQLGEGVSSPYQRAQAIEQFLAEHYQIVADAASGHAYPNLAFFLFGPRNGGGQRGTSEQFAAAFAVLARILGLPTRVVVGFEVRPGHAEVRGADALAWPEVLFNGLGWVPFNPLPEPNAKPRPVEDDFHPKPEPSAPPPSAAPTPSASLSAPKRPSPSASPAPAGAPPTAAITGVLAGGGGAALLGYVIVVPLLRRAQRRRRLRGGDPATRVLGAWRELRDGLRQAGQPAPAYLTATEVTGYAALAADSPAHRRGRPAAALRPPTINDLAVLVNAVTFAEVPLDEATADHAVVQATGYVAELRARRPRWRRVLWALDPRPLRWARQDRTDG